MRYELSYATYLFAALLLSACLAAPQVETPAPIMPAPTSIPPTRVILPTPTPIPLPEDPALPPTPDPTPSFDMLGPYKLKAGEVTFDVSVDVHENQVNFNIHCTYPIAYELAAPDGMMPELYESVDLKVTDKTGKEALLTIAGGGGGGGSDGVTNETSSGIAYKVEPNLIKGEKVHVKALVTFGDYFGIKETLSFDYDLVVKGALKP